MSDAKAGRFAAPAMAHLAAHKDVVVAETAQGIHAFDTAHLVMLVEQDLVTRDAGATLLRTLLAVEGEEGGATAARVATGGGNHAGERLLTQRLGADLGGQLGLARSSGDLSAVSIRLYLRTTIEAALGAIEAARDTLLSFATMHIDTVMVGMTHGQHGQPTTLGHWAMMVEAACARDAYRLEALYHRANQSPAGAGIMTGSDFLVDRARTAALLGFDGVIDNTMDAVLSHDIEMEFASVGAILAQTLARVADDVMLWSTFEFGWVELPDWLCGTSSLMPQKKNPDGLEDIKSLAAEAIGLIATVMVVERGPTGYPIIERRTSDRALRTFAARLIERLNLLPDLFRSLLVDKARMAAAAGRNWAQASDLAGLLVRDAGIDWRAAHHVVGGFIRRCVAAGLTPADDLFGMFIAEARSKGVVTDGLSRASLSAALDPVQCVARRRTAGGPAPQIVVLSIVDARKALLASRAKRGERIARIDAATVALRQAAHDIIAAI